jgi:hypothetical protein
VRRFSGYPAFNQSTEGLKVAQAWGAVCFDDAVTSGRQAKGHWLLRDALFFDPGRWLLPTAHLVSDTPDSSAQRSPLFNTVSVGKPSLGADYQRVEPLSYSHLEEGVLTP